MPPAPHLVSARCSAPEVEAFANDRIVKDRARERMGLIET